MWHDGRFGADTFENRMTVTIEEHGAFGSEARIAGVVGSPESPGAWDLLTGRRLPLKLERSYGCGIVAGAPRMLIFRSATLAYIDLPGPTVTRNYGGIRPGCWIPGIPAGGLLLMPDAASWCTCSYLNQGTVALRGRPAAAGR